MSVIAARLLSEAQAAATSSLIGLPAVKQNLQLLADAVYSTILRQVAVGMWRELGVVEVEQMAGLRVTVEFGNALRGEPPLCARYDFTQTALPTLRAWPVSPS